MFIEVANANILKQVVEEAVKSSVQELLNKFSVEKTKSEEDTLLTKKEAARHLGISTVTLNKYIRDGKVKALSIAGKRQRFWKTELSKSLKVQKY